MRNATSNPESNEANAETDPPGYVDGEATDDPLLPVDVVLVCAATSVVAVAAWLVYVGAMLAEPEDAPRVMLAESTPAPESRSGEPLLPPLLLLLGLDAPLLPRGRTAATSNVDCPLATERTNAKAT